MAKGDTEDLAAQAAKRAEFRVHHVGTKLNERELGELDGLLAQRSQTQGEFIRGLILAEIERDREGVRASAELVEIAAVRLLLVNFLKPLATGEPLTVKTFDSFLRWRWPKSSPRNTRRGLEQRWKYPPLRRPSRLCAALR
jgi:hypothetical protein